MDQDGMWILSFCDGMGGGILAFHTISMMYFYIYAIKKEQNESMDTVTVFAEPISIGETKTPLENVRRAIACTLSIPLSAYAAHNNNNERRLHHVNSIAAERIWEKLISESAYVWRIFFFCKNKYK